MVLQAFRNHVTIDGPREYFEGIIEYLVECLLKKQIQECIEDYEMGGDEMSDLESNAGEISDSGMSDGDI